MLAATVGRHGRKEWRVVVLVAGGGGEAVRRKVCRDVEQTVNRVETIGGANGRGVGG